MQRALNSWIITGNYWEVNAALLKNLFAWILSKLLCARSYSLKAHRKLENEMPTRGKGVTI